MVNDFKGSSEVQENKDVDMARVCREEEVVCYFEESCFITVFGVETRLEYFKEITGRTVVLEL